MYIEIDGWRSNLRFSACHFIPEYTGAPRVHGYTYTVNVRIHGEVDELGIIIDFEHIKSKLNNIIESLDHKVIVPQNYVVNEDKTNVYFEVMERTYSIPRSEVVLLDTIVPSAEELSRIILKEFISQFEMPNNVTKLELGLDESWGQGAWSSWEMNKS